MLTHPTTDRLRELGLAGMARAVEEQRRHANAAELSFEDRLAMLVGMRSETLERDGKRLAARLRFPGLRQQATRIDRAPSGFARHGPDRHGQNLVVLRPRSSRLPEGERAHCYVPVRRPLVLVRVRCYQRWGGYPTRQPRQTGPTRTFRSIPSSRV